MGSFVREGAKRTILGYAFGIYTGGAKPTCCKKTSYGPYESKAIMNQVSQLINNEWIKRCEELWGSMIVLSKKIHQDHITSIDKLFCCMCVYYRRLNSITKPFKFHIP